LLAACVLATTTASVAQPSFDCAKATTPTEKAICGNARLSRLDRAIATALRRIKDDLPNGETMTKEQTAFLKARDACGTDVGCLRKTMDVRRVALSLERNMPRDPRDAF